MSKAPRLPSNMEHSFSKVPSIKQERSSFKRNSTWKGTFDTDYLIPCYLDEVLPGDTMDVKLSAVIRTATPKFPIMDNLKVKYEAFFIPMRLVWDNTEKFFGEQKNPGDAISFVIPTLAPSLAAATYGDKLPDYLGLPIGNVPSGTVTVNNLPFRCYAKCYDEWYRDQNLQDSLDVYTDDSSNVIANGNWQDVRKRCKSPDYFTSGLPWPQKFEATTLPLGTSAPVVGVSPQVAPVFQDDTNTYSAELSVNATSTDVQSFTGQSGGDDLFWKTTGLEADLSTASAPSVNEFRQAIAIQHMNEIYARSGSRYPEVMLGHFGVQSEDARLQRPELLGIGSTFMQIHSVPQTEATSGSNAQGSLSAFGEVQFSDKLFTKSFTEHGYIMIMLSVVGDITYSQGIEKLWSRSTKDDFYWPSFNGIGEQAIESKEIFADGSAGDADVFAYQERFAEYRYKTSYVTSLFRPKRTSNLAAWHLSEEFSTRPTLGNTFIQSNTPMDRAIAVTSEPHFIADVYIQNKSARAMPVFSNPGLYRI